MSSNSTTLSTSTRHDGYRDLLVAGDVIRRQIISPCRTLTQGNPKRRRKSSGLGGEIRAEDTSVPAIATWDYVRPPSSRTRKVSKRPPTYSCGARSPVVGAERQRPKDALLKTAESQNPLPAMEKIPLKAYLGYSSRPDQHIPSSVRLNPSPSNPIHHFIFLSYPMQEEPGIAVQYGKGRWDLAFVFFWTIVLSFTREFIMQKLLQPVARRSGLKSRAKQARFMGRCIQLYILDSRGLGDYTSCRILRSGISTPPRCTRDFPTRRTTPYSSSTTFSKPHTGHNKPLCCCWEWKNRGRISGN